MTDKEAIEVVTSIEQRLAKTSELGAEALAAYTEGSKRLLALVQSPQLKEVVSMFIELSLRLHTLARDEAHLRLSVEMMKAKHPRVWGA